MKKITLAVFILCILLFGCKKNVPANEDNCEYAGKIASVEVKTYPWSLKCDLDSINAKLKVGDFVYKRTYGFLGILRVESIIEGKAICTPAKHPLSDCQNVEFDVGANLYFYNENVKPWGLVTASRLNVRTKPESNASVVGVVEKGTFVDILSKKEGEILYIDGGYGNWVTIRHNDITGWVFGGFVKQDVRRLDETDQYAWVQDEYSSVVIYDLKTKKEIRFDEGFGFNNFDISKPPKYIAIDSGTDVIGGFVIYEIASKKEVYSATHPRDDPKWNGLKISIREIVGECDNNKTPWEEIIFDDGKITKGKAKGFADCH